MITKRPFGALEDGTAVSLWELTNERGLTAQVLDYGVTIRSVLVPDKRGKLVDVVLGYDTLKEYVRDGCYLGTTVGRCANRIKGASFELNGKTYPLYANNGENHLHGGKRGFNKYVWNGEQTGEAVTFSRLSPDGEEGYPGNLQVQVTIGWEGDSLTIRYEATTDQDTVVNLTNHSYFNLNGCQDGSILGHRLQIFADRLTEADAESLPNGTIYQAAGTPMDFRQLTAIGERIDDSFQQLQWGAGYDHNWILSDQKETSLHKAAYAEGDKSGISLTVYTDLPGLQFYSGNFLDGTPGKGGISYGKRSSFALETQYYPNSPAHPEFPQPILKKDETWKSVTVFAAGTVK